MFSREEIYLTMEPAHQFAFGWGMMPTEFREGSRSWLFPGLLGLVWKAASGLGLHTASGLVTVSKVWMAVLSIASVWLAMSLARRLGGERVAIVAGLLLAACPPLIAFGSRCFTETVSVPLVVGAVLLLDGRRRRDAAIAGALVATTVFLNVDNLVITLALLALLLAQRRRSDAKVYAIAAAATVLLGGLLDWPTWGTPFHSLALQVKQTVSAMHPTRYDHAALFYYTDHFRSSMGASYGIMLLGLVLGANRARGLVVVILIDLLIGVLLPSKELRFMLPAIVLAIPIAATGLVRLFDGLRAGAWPSYALGFLCAGQMAWIARAPTRGDLGYGGSDWVTWHSGEDYFQATEEAAKDPGLCGLIYGENEPPWTGGYTFLHRNVPIFYDTKADRLAAANAVIGVPTSNLPKGWVRGLVVGKYALWRRPGGCSSVPKDWKMVLP